MVAVEQDTGFAFVIEIRAKVDSANHMPASLKSFLKVLLDVLGCVFEVGDLILDHLHVYVFSKCECVVLHFYLHVTELYVD